MRNPQRTLERRLFTCKSGTSLSKTTATSRRGKRAAARKFMARFNSNRQRKAQGARTLWRGRWIG